MRTTTQETQELKAASLELFSVHAQTECRTNNKPTPVPARPTTCHHVYQQEGPERVEAEESRAGAELHQSGRLLSGSYRRRWGGEGGWLYWDSAGWDRWCSKDSPYIG